jgi:hypothetical protein
MRFSHAAFTPRDVLPSEAQCLATIKREVHSMSKISAVTLKAFCFAAGLSTLPILALPNLAHAGNGSVVIGQYDGWTTTLDRNPGGVPFCMLSSDMRDGGTFAVISTPDQTFLAVQDAQWTEGSGAKISIDAQLNGHDYSGTGTADAGDVISIPVNKDFVQDFINGDEAVINLGGNVVWTVDLAGTDQAAEDMDNCVTQLTKA